MKLWQRVTTLTVVRIKKKAAIKKSAGPVLSLSKLISHIYRMILIEIAARA
jgi:hypothetical protein